MSEIVRPKRDQEPAWKRLPFMCVPEGKLRSIEGYLNLASAFIVLFLMFFATSEIIARYFFNHPIPGHIEIVELLMAGAIFFGCAHTERIGGHVRMELFVTRTFRGRFYHFVEAFTTALSLFFILFVLFYSYKYALSAYKMGDVTGYILWPTWPSKLAVSFGCFFLSLRFVIEIIQHVVQAMSGGEVRNMD